MKLSKIEKMVVSAGIIRSLDLSGEFLINDVHSALDEDTISNVIDCNCFNLIKGQSKEEMLNENLISCIVDDRYVVHPAFKDFIRECIREFSAQMEVVLKEENGSYRIASCTNPFYMEAKDSVIISDEDIEVLCEYIDLPVNEAFKNAEII